MNIQNLNLFPYLSPKINFFLIRSIRRLNLVDALKDFLIKSQVVQKFLDLLDIVWTGLLVYLVAESLKLNALFLDCDHLLDADFWLKNLLTPDLLDFHYQILVPLLILFFHIVFCVWILLFCEIVCLVESVVQSCAILVVADCLVKHFFDKLILQRVVIQVNSTQNLLDLVVVGLVGVYVQFRQDILLFVFLKHFKNWVDELKSGDSFSWKFLVSSLFLFGLFGDFCDELVDFVIGVEVDVSEVLLELFPTNLR